MWPPQYLDIKLKLPFHPEVILHAFWNILEHSGGCIQSETQLSSNLIFILFFCCQTQLQLKLMANLSLYTSFKALFNIIAFLVCTFDALGRGQKYSVLFLKRILVMHFSFV